MKRKSSSTSFSLDTYIALHAKLSARPFRSRGGGRHQLRNNNFGGVDDDMVIQQHAAGAGLSSSPRRVAKFRPCAAALLSTHGRRTIANGGLENQLLAA